MNFSSLLKGSAEFSFLLFLSLVLVFPVIFGWMKLLLLAYFAAVVLLVDVTSRRPVLSVHGSVLTFMYALLIVNGFFVLRGLLNGASAEASVEVVSVYLVYPIFYLFLIFLAPPLIDLKRLSTVLVLVSIVISCLTIAQGLRVVGRDMVPGYSLLFHIYPGLAAHHIDFAFTGDQGFLPRATERLIFLAPFSVGLLVAGRALGLSRFVVMLNLLLVIAATAFTGRRALLMTLLLAVATLLVRWFLMAPRRSALVVAAWVGFALLAFAGFSITGAGSSVLGGENTRIEEYVVREFGNVSFDTRSIQLEKIAGAADEKPMLGSGYGNGITGYVRDPAHPWRVELTYIALLFQTGAIGIILYLLVARVFVGIISTAMRTAGISLLPIVFGLGGGLLAAATNPYLNYGTGQWILFLPVAVFNGVLIAGAGTGLATAEQSNGHHGLATAFSRLRPDGLS